MKELAVLIDGGYLRVNARQAGERYDPDFIEAFARSCTSPDEEQIFRILYYDCAPYVGSVRLPVSGERHEFTGSDAWLRDLARRDLFAVRLGVLKFRGFKPKRIPVSSASALTDNDFRADFEQKGVDMRIGLDIAVFADQQSVDRICLVSGDTDCVPAMKHARKEGLQVVIAQLANCKIAPELVAHCDFRRPVAWPRQGGR